MGRPKSTPEQKCNTAARTARKMALNTLKHLCKARLWTRRSEQQMKAKENLRNLQDRDESMIASLEPKVGLGLLNLRFRAAETLYGSKGAPLPIDPPSSGADPLDEAAKALLAELRELRTAKERQARIDAELKAGKIDEDERDELMETFGQEDA